MKVGLVRARYSPFGGAERVINAAAASLTAQGHVPTLVTRAWPDSGGAGLDHRIVNPRYWTSAGRDRGFARAACALLAAERFDLVQSYERLSCCDVFHAVEGVHAEWLEQRRRIQSPLQRAGVALNPHHRHVLDAERRMFHSPRLRAVICVSEMVRQEIAGRFSVPPDRLKVIYGAIDATHFHPGLRDAHRAAARAQLGIPSNAPVALFVGSGFERKGVAAFLAVLAKLGGLHGLIVGHDKHIRRYRARAAQLGVDRRVTFTGGIGDVRPYYGAADVFLMPTIYEPFGLTFGEAMACGLPVVASRKAGAADWIRDGENGYIVDPLDIGAIVRAVEGAIANPGMGAAGRRTVLAYAPAKINDDYAAFYRALPG